jgi:hypothetical protein
VIVGDIAASRPGDEVAADSIAFARPKSRTLTLPSGVILTFAGLRWRWTTPWSCAASSASPRIGAVVFYGVDFSADEKSYAYRLNRSAGALLSVEGVR